MSYLGNHWKFASSISFLLYSLIINGYTIFRVMAIYRMNVHVCPPRCNSLIVACKHITFNDALTFSAVYSKNAFWSKTLIQPYLVMHLTPYGAMLNVKFTLALSGPFAFSLWHSYEPAPLHLPTV